MGGIVVIGSINMDVVNRVKEFPLPGETIHGNGTSYHGGGKGANQAVAASLAGAAVRMIGAVGTDAFGSTLLAGLGKFGVDTAGVRVKEGTSGLAFITVSDSGENTIILSAGGNGKLRPDDIAADQLEGADCVLLQNEIPWETNLHVMRLCRSLGVDVLYNPAPASSARLSGDVLGLVRTLVLNETEAEALTGLAVRGAEGAGRAAERLIAEGVGQIVVTLGREGSLYADAHGALVLTPAFPVEAVDTTAAGDTFIGAFAAARQAGGELSGQLRFASAAAALTVTRAGAQESIPAKEEIDAFLRSRCGGS